jgi:hypothetical protein
MEKEILTEVLINAKPEKIWTILADFKNYPKWNPFIQLIEGNVKVGNTITVRIAPPDAKAMTFNPKILAFSNNKEFRWIGRFLLPGLLDGEHKFELFDNGNETTTFRQSEKFNGILIPLFKKLLDKNTRDGFNQMNLKLKELAEKN